MLRLRRVTSWRPTGAFGRGEPGVEFGRDPPVSESRSSSSGVRVLPTCRSRQILRFRVEMQLSPHRVPGVESPGLSLIQAGQCPSSSDELSRGDRVRRCVGVARESACEELHKGCEVVDGDPLSESSGSLAEVSRPRVACTKTATQERRRVLIVPLEKMPMTLRVAGEGFSWLVQGQAGGQSSAV